MKIPICKSHFNRIKGLDSRVVDNGLTTRQIYKEHKKYGTMHGFLEKKLMEMIF
jgi:hypothetical protein